jgi:hypothetical protein
VVLEPIVGDDGTGLLGDVDEAELHGTSFGSFLAAIHP